MNYKFGIYVQPAITPHGQASCGYLTETGELTESRCMAQQFETMQGAIDKIRGLGLVEDSMVRPGVGTAYVSNL